MKIKNSERSNIVFKDEKTIKVKVIGKRKEQIGSLNE